MPAEVSKTTSAEAPVALVVTQLRASIRRAEACADEALIAKADLLQKMLRARQAENVPTPHVGQDAIMRLGKAIQADIASASDLFRTHNALSIAGQVVFGNAPHEDTPEYVEPADALEAGNAMND